MHNRSIEIIDENSTVVLNQRYRASELDRELIVLDLNSESYFGLDGVGASIWKRLEVPQTFLSLYKALLEDYEIEADQCWTDLLLFLQELAAGNLIEVRNEPC